MDFPIAVFVMSCDKTSDVARYFIAAFTKYWPDCPYPVYFGVNRKSPDLATLEATLLPSEIKGWQKETMEQLQVLRILSPRITHVLVFLDDYILNEKIDTTLVQRVLADAAAKDVAYLRLRRLEEGVVGRMKQRLTKRYVFGSEPFIKVRPNHPYHSSLQIALWRSDHLTRLVERSDDIWMFERHSTPETTHYAALKSLIKYRHIVEKGEWDIWAEVHCRKAIGWFDDSGRPGRVNNIRSRMMSHVCRIRFMCFGYLPMRVKRQIFNACQKACDR
jgi:hypothetical protein